jgi:hypothetical protein
MTPAEICAQLERRHRHQNLADQLRDAEAAAGYALHRLQDAHAEVLKARVDRLAPSSPARSDSAARLSPRAYSTASRGRRGSLPKAPPAPLLPPT